MSFYEGRALEGRIDQGAKTLDNELTSLSELYVEREPNIANK